MATSLKTASGKRPLKRGGTRYFKMKKRKTKRKIILADYTKEVKHKMTFSEYLDKFYSNKPRRPKKKQRVIVSAGRVIF